jgi:hypothetical protein
VRCASRSLLASRVTGSGYFADLALVFLSVVSGHRFACRDVHKIPARRRCDRVGTLCTEPSDEWSVRAASVSNQQVVIPLSAQAAPARPKPRL